MSKFTVGTKWQTPSGTPLEVIKQENLARCEPYIHFQVIGSEPPRFVVRYKSECTDLKPLLEQNK